MDPDGFPNSLQDYERGLLGMCLTEADCWHRAAQRVSQDDLADYFVRRVWSATSGLVDAGLPVDSTTLIRAIGAGAMPEHGWEHWLASIVDERANPAMLKHYCKTIVERSRTRRLVNACQEIAEEAAELPVDAPIAVVEFWKQTEARLGELTTPPDPDDQSTDAAEFAALHAEVDTPQPFGLPAGLKELDELIDGLQPGRLYIVGARPGVGKTVAALQIALNISIGITAPMGTPKHRVVFVSLEMSRKELRQRSVANLSQVPLNRVRRGTATPDELDRTHKAVDILKENTDRLVISEPPALTIAQLQHYGRAQKKDGARVLVVDYLQLLQAPRRDSRVQEVAEITAGLKSLARELQIPVLVPCQLSRAASDGKPQLHHLRESGSIEQDADVVLLLWREFEDDKQSPLVCEVAKNRHGPTGLFKLTMLRETFRLVNYSPLEA